MFKTIADKDIIQPFTVAIISVITQVHMHIYRGFTFCGPDCPLDTAISHVIINRNCRGLRAIGIHVSSVVPIL